MAPAEHIWLCQESQETSEEEEPFADAMEIPEMSQYPNVCGEHVSRRDVSVPVCHLSKVLPKLETAVETFSSFGLVQRGFGLPGLRPFGSNGIL